MLNTAKHKAQKNSQPTLEDTVEGFNSCLKYMISEASSSGLATTTKLLELALVTIQHDYITLMQQSLKLHHEAGNPSLHN